MKLNRSLFLAASLIWPALCLAQPQSEREHASATSLPIGQDEPIGLNTPATQPAEPASPGDFALMSLLYKTPGGEALKASRIKAYGWLNPSFNLSTSEYSNSPEGYAIVPDRPELSQGVFRIERLPDTAQTDHLDWGFRITNLYGIDYRTTVAKGWWSDRLLRDNELYGYDMPEAYLQLYLPKLAAGTTITVGRFFSPVDIESVTAPDNAFMTHSIMNNVDPVTFTGAMMDIALNKQWALQLGAHAGSDMTPWEYGALNGHAMVRWTSESNDDMVFAGVNSVGDGKYRGDHDNMQQVVGLWTHKFNDKFRMGNEVYYMWQFDANMGGSVNYGPVRRFGGGGGPGWVIEGRSDCVGAVNFLNYQLTPKDVISLRSDYLWDDDGQRTGLRNSYWSESVGWNHSFTDWLTVRPELRYEKSFNLPAYDLGDKSSQFMCAVDLILRF